MKAQPIPHNDGRLSVWPTLGICLGLALMVVAVYAPVRHFEFLNYDDDVYVTDNPVVQAGLTAEGVRWALTFSEIGHWHPLTWLSHMLDCDLFGLNAGGPHLVNVLLHAATAILLFLVLRQMTSLRPGTEFGASPPPAGAMWSSAFAAALFAIHPLRVESVAWIAERKDVLGGFFFMLTLWAYGKYVSNVLRRVSGGGAPHLEGHASRVTHHATLWHWLCLLFFALGLLVKNMLVTLPFLLLLLDYWPLRRFERSMLNAQRSTLWHLVREKIPLFLLSAASCVATSFTPETISPAGRWTLAFRFGNALVSYVAYVWQMLVPRGLAVPYAVPAHGLDAWKVIGALCLLAAVSVSVILLRRRRPYLAVGWFWYLGMLVPVIGLVQISYYPCADRYTYLPQIGLAVAIAWLATDLTARRRWQRPVLTALALSVISVLLLLTANQVSVWRNNFTLWTHTLACMPDNAYAHNGLGIALAARGRPDEAIQHYRDALKTKPDFVQARNNLGNALLAQKKVDEAIAQFNEALRIEPRFALTHNNLGNALGVAGRTDEAIARYQQAIQLKPDFALAYGNLGNALLAWNRTQEAVAAYREALRLEPNVADRELSLGNALLKLGQVEEAITHLSRGLHFDPALAEARLSLADVLLEQGRSDEAIAQCEEALLLKPGLAAAHYQMGKALSKQGRFAEAISSYEAALQLQPAYPEAHNNLGNLLAMAGRSQEALVHYQDALRLQPDNVEAHNNYGGLLLQQGRVAEALAQYEEVLRLNTNYVPALRNLAWLRAACADATFRDGTQALELARQAVALTGGQDATALDALAAAQAEAGHFEEAVATARKARELASAANQIPLVNQIEMRLKLYSAGSAYRLKP